MLPEDFKEFLRLLTENEVEYLIVGGYAVAYYGYPRYTGDLDIWIKPDINNYKKVTKTIIDFGFASLKINEKDFELDGSIIQLGYPPIRIDIMNDLDGVQFEECFQQKCVIKSDNIEIFIIDLKSLIKNKTISGRYKDLDDVEHLG